MALALDGKAAGSTSATLTTTASNDVIIAVVETNTAATTAIVGGGLTWTLIGRQPSGANYLSAWYAIAVSPLTAVVITPTAVGEGFISTSVFGISGANTPSPFDGTFVSANSGTISVVTSNANDIVIGCARCTTPSTDAGFTTISNSSFLSTEYKILSAPSAGLTIGAQTGQNGVIGFAIKAGPSVQRVPPFRIRQFKRKIQPKVKTPKIYLEPYLPVIVPWMNPLSRRIKQFKRRIQRVVKTVKKNPPNSPGVTAFVWSGAPWSSGSWSSAGKTNPGFGKPIIRVYKTAWPRLRTRKRWAAVFRPKHIIFPPAKRPLVNRKPSVQRMHYRKRWAPVFQPRHLAFPLQFPFKGGLRTVRQVYRKRKLLKALYHPYKLDFLLKPPQTSWTWSSGPFSGGPFSSAGRVLGVSYSGRGLRLRPLIRPKRKPFRNFIKKLKWYPLNPAVPPPPVAGVVTWIWSAAPWSSGPYSSAGRAVPPAPPPPPPPPPPPIVPTATTWMWSSGPWSSGVFSAAGRVTNPPPPPVPQPPQQYVSGVTVSPLRVAQATLQRLRKAAASLSQARSVSSALQVLRGAPPTLKD